MTELNRTAINDFVDIWKDESGTVQLLFDGRFGELKPAEAARLCQWLMNNLPIEAWKDLPITPKGIE